VRQGDHEAALGWARTLSQTVPDPDGRLALGFLGRCAREAGAAAPEPQREAALHAYAAAAADLLRAARRRDPAAAARLMADEDFAPLAGRQEVREAASAAP
jgi:hypothetical protein